MTVRRIKVTCCLFYREKWIYSKDSDYGDHTLTHAHTDTLTHQLAQILLKQFKLSL